jgi:hypothetical protein
MRRLVGVATPAALISMSCGGGSGTAEPTEGIELTEQSEPRSTEPVETAAFEPRF